MHRLDVPAGADELGRQPVEQLGVRRRLALDAEVLGRLDQARAEMVLPDPVDGHAGRQRVVGTSQPARQAEAVARRAGGQRRQARRDARLDLLALCPACRSGRA